MSVSDQLSYEARVRTRQALVAGGTALLLIAAAAAQLAGSQVKVSELTVQLIQVHKRFPLDLVGAVVDAVGLLGLIWSLTFLFGVARAGKPEMSPAVRTLAIAGGIVSGIGGIVYAAVIAAKASEFVQHGTQSYVQAKQVTKGAALPALQTLDIAAQFVLALAIILIALNAMRVGLLTRFMGYFGILAGAASMLLIGSPPAVALQVFWLLALGFLFSGRWPNGDPPSWRTGRAEPWPSSVEMREQRMKQTADKAQKPAREPAAVASKPAAEGAGAARTRASTPKRKRKKRR